MLIYNQKVEMNSFYKYLKETNFNIITQEMIKNIKENSKTLNKFFNMDNGLLKSSKYLKIMNKIKTNPKGFNISTNAEMYLLFMFIIDPKFELVKEYNSCNNKEDIEKVKLVIQRKTGIYDINLILLENLFIKNFLPKEELEFLEN